MSATILITDLTPKFLTFYEQAREAEPDRRWELWNEHYGFAAVPPTPEGMAMARKLLDQSFHRYPEALDVIRAGAGGMRPDPHAVLEDVCRLLKFAGDVTVRLVAYVGNFEQNAFAYTQDGEAVINVPVEESEQWRRLILPHELTHVVHAHLSGAGGGWVRSVGYAVMQEGLAMHAAMRLAPGQPECEYVEFSPGWLAEARAQERAVLAGIRPFLNDSSDEALSRFIFGPGPAGLEREAYYAGYRAVGHLLDRGSTPAQLARIAEEDAPAYIDAVIGQILGG